jgi:hypothetical protein
MFDMIVLGIMKFVLIVCFSFWALGMVRALFSSCKKGA